MSQSICYYEFLGQSLDSSVEFNQLLELICILSFANNQIVQDWQTHLLPICEVRGEFYVSSKYSILVPRECSPGVKHCQNYNKHVVMKHCFYRINIYQLKTLIQMPTKSWMGKLWVTLNRKLRDNQNNVCWGGGTPLTHVSMHRNPGEWC